MKIGNKIPVIGQEKLGGKSIFYVGGECKGTDGKHFMSGQMFVEAYIPVEITRPYPIIMFHGAGQTNVNWLITPDGRMGWADYFVSQGYVVYLAEQPARGRSAYHPETDGPRMYHSIEALKSRFASREGEWEQAKTHTQWPEEVESGDPIFRQFVLSQVEYLRENRKSQELVAAAGKELLEKTGPAILVTHSQAGPFGWLLADQNPEYVKGIVALEPSGPPFSQDTSSAVAKNYGVADLPMNYEPFAESPEEIALEMKSGTRADEKAGWVMKEPARKLPNLAGIPTLILTGESSYHGSYDHLTSYVLRQAGVEHDFIRLETVGIHGNGHMMMLEKNNLEIAGFICGWLEKKVRGEV